MSVQINYRDWIAIEVSFNQRTLSAVIEGCDINSTQNIQKSIQMQVNVQPKNSIVLHGDSHNSSWKNLSFYNEFHDAVQLDECIDICVEGEGKCPSTYAFCSLDGGNKKIQGNYLYNENCAGMDTSRSSEWYQEHGYLDILQGKVLFNN